MLWAVKISRAASQFPSLAFRGTLQVHLVPEEKEAMQRAQMEKYYSRPPNAQQGGKRY